MSLVDKVVLITGAGRPNGIGAGIARCFANDAAKVVITSAPRSSAQAYRLGVRARIRSKPCLIAVKRASIAGSNSVSVNM